jgi:hypothetical protein
MITAIQQIISKKSEVLDNYESNVSNDRKREVLISSNLMASTLSDNVNTLRDIFMTDGKNNLVFLYLKP